MLNPFQWIGRRVLGTAAKLVQHIFIPVVSWAARRAVPEMLVSTSPSPGGYVLPDASITPLLLMRSHEDESKTDPTVFQSELNACLEALRGSETIRGALLAMFGSLIASGYPPEEAFCRFGANTILLGIYMERRLNRPAGDPPIEPPAQQTVQPI